MPEQADLLDINVWLALGVHDHPHHERASRYWHDEAGDRLVFCRVTMLGFLRLSTNAAPMRGRPLTVAQAWQACGAFRRQPGVTLDSDPEGIETTLEPWISAGIVRPGLWTDAYLAAFAAAGGLRLVSFDRDFRRFPGLNLLLLEG